MGEAYLAAGWPDEALDGFRRARRWVRGQAVPTIRLAAASGDAHLAAGRSAPAVRWYQKASDTLAATDGLGAEVRATLRARIDLGYASARLAKGDLDQAERWAGDALAAAELSGDERMRDRAVAILDTVREAR
jgi:tetratricopeptide (TPR) repeat protein